MAKTIGACLHGNRYHCWHNIDRDYPKIIVFECCICHKRKIRFKPGMKPDKPKFIRFD